MKTFGIRMIRGQASLLQRGQTLVATLIVLAIIAILAVVLLRGTGGGESTRADGRGTTVVGAVKAQAEDTVCMQYLNQIRQSIAVYQTTDDGYPATLQDTRLGETFYRCPMGKEPYAYDPSTGKVSCRHPGHEKY